MRTTPEQLHRHGLEATSSGARRRHRRWSLTMLVALANPAQRGHDARRLGGREGPLLRHRDRGGKLSDSTYVGDPEPRVQHGHGRERDEVGRHRAVPGPASTTANGDRIVNHAREQRQAGPRPRAALARAAARLGAEPVRHRAAQRDDQPRHPGRHPLPGQDLRLGRGQRGVRRRRRRRPARLEPAAHRQRLDRGRVPRRPGRRPGRQALLQRLQHRRHQREVHRHLQHGRATSRPAACRSTASASSRTSAPACPATTRPTCSASPTSASTCRSPSWTSSRAPTRPTSTPP